MSTTSQRSDDVVYGVEPVAPGILAITSEPEPRSGLQRAWRRTRRVLLGPPLPSRVERAERLGIFAAVALIGSDMLASSVYGPEEMIRHLGEVGVAGVGFALPVAAAIGLLLAVLTLSYQQTITAYPNGAGGYIVASENLGPVLGVVGAAALLIDYTLDVAVSIATGVQSVTSALPQLAGVRMWLCLGALVLITLANLRGIRAAGLLLSAPVYMYVVGTLAVVVFGIVLATTGNLPPYTPPESARGMLAESTGAISLLLLLRAFSSGAIALTGIEAISDGVPYMKEPSAQNARRALLLMAGLFAAMFLGLAFIAGQLGVVADPAEVETVHSQITRSVLGQGWLFVGIEAAAVLTLILAANTGFADFPRLLALLARDNYLPPAFSARGSRLAFSNGIMFVALLSALLLIAFNGSVAGLAPLFTIGAFLTFTMSQSGMVRFWRRKRTDGWHWRLTINLIGAVTTAVVLGVVLASKFQAGAWIIVLALPALSYLIYALGSHQQRLLRTAAIEPDRADSLVEALASHTRHHIIIPIAGPDRVALHAIAYVISLFGESGTRRNHQDENAPVVEAVHVTDDRVNAVELQREWQAAHLPIPLVVLESPYRATAEALLRYLDYLTRDPDHRTVVTVVIPETLPTRWWHPLMRNYLAWRLKWSLLFRPGVTVLSVPLLLRD